MEFDWITVVLEVINFLVLVWLLRRFFYQPVLEVIEQRRAATEKVIADAEAMRGAAQALKEDYTQRLADVAAERARALARLDAEIAAERSRRLARVEAEASADRQRREMLDARERSAAEAAQERRALAIAGRFASAFLDRLAGPELEARLVDLALADLEAAPPDRVAELAAALGDPALTVEVVSAGSLDAERRAAFASVLGGIAGRPVRPAFREDPELRAGVCVSAGSWVLMANLRDELGFFGSAFEHEREQP